MTIMIAGERSGVGKTTITLALLAYLCDRTLSTLPPSPSQNPTVQSFKVGPDYIDPMFHTYVTGRPCRNLDPVLTSEDYVRQCFALHCQDTNYAIIEGVMGLFDGASGTDDTASSAHIARLLDIPIVLVLDCSRLARSVAAILHGYTTFDSRLKFAGVILNRVGSDRHLHLLATAITPLNIPILGVLRRETTISIPDRHLGLIPTAELPALDNVIAELRAIATAQLNWDALLPLLETSPDLLQSGPKAEGRGAEGQRGRGAGEKGRGAGEKGRGAGEKGRGAGELGSRGERDAGMGRRGSPSQNPKSKILSSAARSLSAAIPDRAIASEAINPKSKIRIAVARDRAFNFYYPDNLDILESLGATLVFWSPLTEALPDDVQGLYFGGGFPEVFGSTLANNRKAQASVKVAIETGLPSYAECGGLMYLCDSIVDFDGVAHSMVGLIPATVQMGKRLSLGYRNAIAQSSTPLVELGQTLLGHEFHRSFLTFQSSAPLYTLQPYERQQYGTVMEDPIQTQIEGWSLYNLHASYVHVHWGAQPHIPRRFLSYCQKNQMPNPSN